MLLLRCVAFGVLVLRTQVVGCDRLGVEWCDLSVRLGRATLVQSTSGRAQAGRLLAVIGPSGAGKTSLLRAMVGIGSGVSGRVVDVGSGKDLGGLGSGEAGYLTQNSELFGTLTVFESLRFAYEMRGKSRKEAIAFADLALEEFGLREVKKRMVGEVSSGKAISGGERQRLCVAIELALCSSVQGPRLILADEPTSGLDSVAAEKVVKSLRDYARARDVAAIATLHQPSSRLWLHYVDDVCVLAPKGRVIYLGSAKDAPKYFEKNFRKKLPAMTNPAEFLLDLVAFDEKDANIYADHWATSRQKSLVLLTETISMSNHRRRRRPPALKRLYLLCGRSLKQVARDKRILGLRLFATIGLGIFLPDRYACYSKKKTQNSLDVACAADRITLLTFSAISVSMLSLVRAFDLFAKERPVAGRERERGLYSGPEYVLAKALAELPSDVLFAALHGATLKWRLETTQNSTLSCSPAKPLAYAAAACGTLGLAIGAATPSAEAALAVGTPLMVVHLLVGIVNPSGEQERDASSFDSFLKAMSPVRHAVVWLLKSEFQGLQLTGNRAPSFGALAFVRSGDDILKRLNLQSDTRPEAHLIALTLAHLAFSAVALSALPRLCHKLLEKIKTRIGGDDSSRKNNKKRRHLFLFGRRRRRREENNNLLKDDLAKPS